ncbi:restriction endonuclease subunit S [Lysobacter soli]|uniref:restriction endonuclease subunit S n=1 Tax=Lysobacter soli TaxID=453783 RepID=UPI0024106D4D|nr:restriction endonuclease subunit S [Lysobacter soli]MDG2518097.1 restriction endonuclease subunit S [Lysobacter soli]
MTLPTYPRYKDSGISWIAAVPSGWEVTPLLGVARERYESNAGMKENNLLSLSYGRIVRKDLESNDGLLPESFETYQVVQPGDTIFRLTDLQNDQRSLRTGLVLETGIITSAYLCVEPMGIDPNYFSYLLRFYDLSKTFYSMGGGLRQSMKYADVKRLPVLIPSKSEQMSIADFLDRETAKIDALIAEQEKLLALLAEKRQATISHAVTRGLNPDTPLKDSGIRWLGQVPAHWEVKQLKHVARPGTAITYGIVQAGPHYDGGVPYIRTSDMSGDRLPLHGYALTSPEIDASYTRSKVAAGDLVIAIRATVGKCLPVPPELDGANLTQGTAKVSPGDEVVPAFLLSSLRSNATLAYFDSMAKGATFKEITLDALRRAPVLRPSKEEQLEIARFIEGETGKLDSLQTDAERAIDLLKERRSALIAAAVTGQIDVRGAVEVQAA